MARTLPVWGEYFAFKMDPVTSLQSMQDDPETVKACDSLKSRCKQYLGCTLGWLVVPFVGNLVPIEVSLLFPNGLFPRPDPSVHAKPEMSLAVSTAEPHLLGRAPLSVQPPLPYPNAYHSTLFTTLLRVKYDREDWTETGKYALMPRQQPSTLRSMRMHDSNWHRRIHAAANTGAEMPSFLPPYITPEEWDKILEIWEKLKSKPDAVYVAKPEDAETHDPEPEPSSPVDSTGSQDPESDSQTSSYSRSCSVNSEVGYIDEVNELRDQAFLEATVIDFIVDLDTIPHEALGNPYEFDGEVAELNEVRRAALDRVTQRKADAQRADAELDVRTALARHRNALATEGEETV